jgi:hypothetical protein
MYFFEGMYKKAMPFIPLMEGMASHGLNSFTLVEQ